MVNYKKFYFILGVKKTVQYLNLTTIMFFPGPFLLTYLLIDTLKKGAPSRIVNLGSESHRYPTHLDISKLTKHFSDEDNFDKFVFYGTTKLCLMLLTTKLSKLLAGMLKLG